MGKDSAFRIYGISCEIRSEKCRYGGVKESKMEKSIISFCTSAFVPWNASKAPVLHLIWKSVHSPTIWYRFQLPMFNSFRTPASILKNARKRPFLYGRGYNFARGSCFAMNVALYARPISSLSNGPYFMSLRPSVAKQSARDPSAVRQFSVVFYFSIFHVNPMEHVMTCWRRHIGRTEPKI